MRGDNTRSCCTRALCGGAVAMPRKPHSPAGSWDLTDLPALQIDPTTVRFQSWFKSGLGWPMKYSTELA